MFSKQHPSREASFAANDNGRFSAPLLGALAGSGIRAVAARGTGPTFLSYVADGTFLISRPSAASSPEQSAYRRCRVSTGRTRAIRLAAAG